MDDEPDESRRLLTTRRTLLSAAAALGSASTIAALTEGGESGTLTAGKTALGKSYEINDRFFIGPDSAKSQVSAESGRVYRSTDYGSGNRYRDFHGDGGSWQSPGWDVSAISTDRLSTKSGGLTELTDDGVWTWYMNPRAIDGGGKTFIGWVNSDGDVEICSYDESEDDVQTNTLKSSLEANDHAAPGLAIDGNGIVYAFYSDQDNTSTIYWKKSTSAHDITTMSAESTISTSSGLEYCNPRIHNGRIWLFYQPIGNHWRYVYSDDGGSSWSSSTEWLTYSGGGGAYIQMDQPDSNGRMDFAASITASATLDDIYHGYFQNGTVYTSSGSSLGSTTDITNLTQVYDSSATGSHPATVFDCSNVNGTPQVLFGTYPDKWNYHEYRYGVYEGGSWTHEKMIGGGSSITPNYRGQWSYSGLAYFDRSEDGVAYASVGDHESGKILRMERNDGGSTWSSEDYSTSDAQNIRPVSPHTPSGDVDAVWLRGQYNYFIDEYATSVVLGRETPNGSDNAGGAGGYVIVSNDSAQSVPHAATNKAVWDNAREDSRDEFDLANNEFVNEEFGLYHIEVRITFQATASGSGTAMAILNVGGGRKDWEYDTVDTTGACSLNVSTTQFLNAGTDVYVEIRQESGSSLDTDPGVATSNFRVSQLR